MTRHPNTANDAALVPGTAGSASGWFVALGAGHVLLGGLVAAVTEPLGLRHGSWLAAYLVLVCGVAQYVMGRAPWWFDHHLAGSAGWMRVGGWNGGNVAVIVGTIAAAPYLADAGGAVLLAVLVATLRDALQPPTAARAAYVTFLVMLAGSVPVGLVLAHLRVG